MLARRSLLGACRALGSAATSARQQHVLPELPYPADALEPVISGEIMELHHGKHHATYVKNLNAAKEQLQSALQSGEWKRERAKKTPVPSQPCRQKIMVFLIEAQH